MILIIALHEDGGYHFIVSKEGTIGYTGERVTVDGTADTFRFYKTRTAVMNSIKCKMNEWMEHRKKKYIK